MVGLKSLVRKKEVQMSNRPPLRDAHAGNDSAGNGFPQAASEEQIVERIFTAVMERRLRPGAKLTEISALTDALGNIYYQVGANGKLFMFNSKGDFLKYVTL